MRKSKILGLSLSGLALVASLVGCNPANPSQSSSSGQSSSVDDDFPTADDPLFSKFTGELEQNVTLHVLENDTAKSLGYLDELLYAFNKEYAKYGITAVDANIDQYTDLAQDGPAGYGPDVLYQANDMIMRYVQGHHVMPLPTEKIEAEKQIPANAKKAYYSTYNDKKYTFGVPVNVQGPLIFYNKSLLPENSDANADGVPDVLESWNNLYAFSKEREEEDPTYRGYMKALYDAYFSTGFEFTYGAYIFGSDNTDSSDIGINKGEAWKGAWELRQLASAMDKTCTDDSINTTGYKKIADGIYFATMSTPDVTNNFIKEMQANYEDQGHSASEALQMAKDNLGVANLPALPESGDLSEANPTLVTMKSMGGINGYAISSYTKYPNDSLAFLNFATSYEQVKQRIDYLGIAPCREDLTSASSQSSQWLYERLNSGDIYLMPSISAVSQIWTPLETLNKDLAGDPFRDEADQKYKTQADFQEGLDKAAQQIEDAITTLGGD